METNVRLTDRELEVLARLARGCTYARTAEELGMSAHTVASHVKNLYRKLDVHSAPAAVMFPATSYEYVQHVLQSLETTWRGILTSAIDWTRGSLAARRLRSGSMRTISGSPLRGGASRTPPYVAASSPASAARSWAPADASGVRVIA